MTDGVLSAVAPVGWRVERYEPSSSDDFPADMLRAMAWDEEFSDRFSRPRVYLGQRSYGTLKDLAEMILSWEEYEMCLSGDFPQIEWHEVEIGALRGYRFRTVLFFEPLPPEQMVEVLVVSRAMSAAEQVESAAEEVLTAVASRCPADDAESLSKVEEFWASLRSCGDGAARLTELADAAAVPAPVNPNTVDLDALRARHRVARSRHNPECDAWFELGGRTGEETFELVSAACAGVSPQAYPVATETGTFVRLFMGDWESACQQIAERLSGAGEAVRVTVPPVPPRPGDFSARFLPCLVMIHRLDPPAAGVSILERDAGHWQLPEAASRRRLDRAAEWLTEPARFAGVGGLRLMPASRLDAGAKLESFFGTIYRVYANSHDEDGSLSREIVFRDWGVSAWCASYPGLTDLERVERLTELLVEFAADLELGVIRMSTALDRGLPSEMHPLERFPPRASWSSVPQLWSAYLPDAHGIQLVNDEQLAKAHDLSDWQIETVSPERHLVSARNLQAWFGGTERLGALGPMPPRADAVPVPSALEKARRDFGDMILTSDTAEEWRAEQLRHSSE